MLQIANPVWPGMGSELVFELWRKGCNQDSAKEGEGSQDVDYASKGSPGRRVGMRDNAAGNASDTYVRVLWGGQPLATSTPLGTLDMVALPALLGYLERTIPRDLVSACAA